MLLWEQYAFYAAVQIDSKARCPGNIFCRQNAGIPNDPSCSDCYSLSCNQTLKYAATLRRKKCS